MADNAYLLKLSRELMDKGKIIEAGWIGLRISAIDPRASAVQLEEMRMGFFAGAAHLFASMMFTLEEGKEPTEADMNRMSKINGELEAFTEEFKLKHAKAKGNA